MNTLFRFAVGAGLLSAVVAAGGHSCPRWSGRAGLNLTEWLELRHQLENERRREIILSHQTQQVAQSLIAKTQVLEEVRNDRLTLLEAAARFRKLSCPTGDESLDWFRQLYPGQTDEERWCRQVIRFLRGHSPEAWPLADRFDAELNWRLAQGSLQLPDE
jgi:hypothetical protein